MQLEDDANLHCDIINDSTFWSGLEQVLGDIEVICYATNLAQQGSTRADQALLSLVGVYLRFSEHPEGAVKAEMLKRLEKRWLSYDQPFYLLSLVLNPREELSCFSDDANLDYFTLKDLAVQVPAPSCSVFSISEAFSDVSSTCVASELEREHVSSADGWREEMARWISAAREDAAEDEEGDEAEEDTPVLRERLTQVRRPRKWQPKTLQKLFGTCAKPSLRTRVSRRAQEDEETYMRVMAELDAVDDSLDDGEVEIDENEVYGD